MIKPWYVQPKVSTILLAVAIVAGTAISAGAATASWDPNTEPDVAGYTLSYGTKPGVHTVVIDVGNVTSYPFNPPLGQTYYVVVQAYNTAGEFSEKSAEVMVYMPFPSVSPGPNAPQLTFAQPANQSTALNTKVSLALSASGASISGNLKFTASGLPPGLSIHASGLISGTPTKAGSYQVTVTVSDGKTLLSRTFSWTIVSAPVQNQPPSQQNQPPLFAQPANQTSALNANVTLVLSASDPEDAVLRFTANGLPQGLSVNSASGVISGVARSTGNYQVTATVSDGVHSVSRSFSWNVVSSNTRSSAASSSHQAGSQLAPLPEAPDGDGADQSQDYVGVTGDFDGDGRNDLATYRRSSSEWRIWTSGSNFATPTVMVWGTAGDVPVAADYNGDRVTDFAIYRPSTGTWHLSLSGSQTPLAMQWGGPEDLPVSFDHDGDGKADLAVIRGGVFEILLSSANYLKSIQIQ